MTTPIAIFQCPADSPRLFPKLPAERTPTTTSYLGIAGTNQFARDGLLFLDSQVSFRQIKDGTSNTLLVGERPPTLDIKYGRWYGGWGPWGIANAYLGVRETELGDPGRVLLPCRSIPVPPRLSARSMLGVSLLELALWRRLFPRRRRLGALPYVLRRAATTRAGDARCWRGNGLAGLT